MVREVSDTGNDLGPTLNELRNALKIMILKRNAAIHGMGLYGVAMAAGRSPLGGFAPVAGTAKPPAGQKRKVAPTTGQGRFALPGYIGAQADAQRFVTSLGAGEAPSYRAAMAQAREQAAAGRARRDSERAGLNLPVQRAGLGAVSFAPLPGGGAGDGVSLQPAIRSADAAPGLRRRGSVHSAVLAAETDATAPGDVEDQRRAAAQESAPLPVAPADIERALEDYFFRQSRLPPAGGAGFNPLLSPVWAGLKIPG
jgi:hypothetical protein